MIRLVSILLVACTALWPSQNVGLIGRSVPSGSVAVIPTLAIPTATTQTSAPTTYVNGTVDTTNRTVPAVSVPSAVNASFQDTSFGRTIYRISNASTGSRLNTSHMLPSSEVSAAWGRNSDRFYLVETDGVSEYFTFNAATTTATYQYDLPFNTEPSFSRVTGNIIYGVSGWQILAYNTDTRTSTVIYDISVSDPSCAVSGHFVGAVMTSASAPERVSIAYCGTSQDRHYHVVVLDAATPSNRLIMDTMAGTINGVTVPTLTSVGQMTLHALGIDQSGQYVILYPPNANNPLGIYGIPPWGQVVIWDTHTGVVSNLPVSPNGAGHVAWGYGVFVNQDNCCGITWDAYEYAYRAVTSLSSPTAVVSPISPSETYLDTHPSWTNARSDAVTPFVDATYRYDEDIAANLDTDPSARLNTAAWRIVDNEVVSVSPSTGTIYRWCHHFANIYVDSWVSGQSQQEFWYEPIPQVSPDGRWILFDSNMGKVLGSDAHPADSQMSFRVDTFLIDTSLAHS